MILLLDMSLHNNMIKLQEFFYPSPIVMSEDVNSDTADIVERLKPHFYVMEKNFQRPLIVDSGSTNVIKKPPILAPPSAQPNDKIPLYVKAAAPPVAAKPLKGNDSLFWAIYGEMCERKPTQYDGGFGVVPMIAQMQEKSRIIAWIQADPKRFQTAFEDHRITKSRVQEIMTQLLTGVADNLDCLLAYAAYYGINAIVWYPRNRTYCGFTNPLASEEIVLEYCGGGGGGRKWRVAGCGGVGFDATKSVKMRHYLGEGGNALWGESAYKKEELVKMAEILEIQVDGCGKKELYEKINMCCYIIK